MTTSARWPSTRVARFMDLSSSSTTRAPSSWQNCSNETICTDNLFWFYYLYLIILSNNLTNSSTKHFVNSFHETFKRRPCIVIVSNNLSHCFLIASALVSRILVIICSISFVSYSYNFNLTSDRTRHKQWTYYNKFYWTRH